MIKSLFFVLILAQCVHAQGLFDWMAQPEPVKQPVLVVQQGIDLSGMTHEQKLDLHDAMHEGSDRARPGHWTYPGDIDTHLQGHIDLRPQPSKAIDVLSLRPDGKFAYIVAVCSPSQYDAWLRKIDVVDKGWGVIRVDPSNSRLAAYVVIDQSITMLGNLPNARDLNRVLMGVAQSRDAAKAKPALEIKIYKRPNCGWCDVWMRDEAPKARAAGAIVLEAEELDNSKPVPHFIVRGADNNSRMFSGFTPFEVMR